MTNALCRCNKCNQLLIDEQPHPYALRYKKLPKSIKKTMHGGCSDCLTDEYIEPILCEEIVTANNLEQAKALMEKTDYLYLMGTCRNATTNQTLNNYIFVK
jgi:hypothetical protein